MIYMRRISRLVLVTIIVTASWLSVPCGNIQPVSTGELGLERITPLTIKVIFVGPYFNSRVIDVSLLRSLIPENKSNLILMDEVSTGVTYAFDYEFVFASSSFRERMVSFLRTIEQEKEEENPWFYFFRESEDWFVTKPTEITSYVYDAKTVEKWLADHMQEFGGFPDNGYVFLIADLRELPSISYSEVESFLKARTYNSVPPPVKAHYYGVSYEDMDRGYRLRNRNLATGWGGSTRMWYLDLSAGPTFVSEWLDLPIQVLEEDQGVDPRTSMGGLWVTELLADYVWEFVYNLAAPNFVYDPQFSRRYRVEVNIFDGRNEEERSAVPIGETFNSTLAIEAFKMLIPYSEIVINTRLMNLSDYPELNNIIESRRGTLDSWIHRYLFLSSTNFSYIDAIPTYEYLRRNLDAFEPNSSRSRNEYVIPVFAFALDDDVHFALKYKWLIMKPNLETGAIWGATLPDLILIGLSHKDFLRGNYVEPIQKDKGLGFTEVVIHEVGHTLGLMHPHTYSDLGDFVSSAMSYYAYEYNFSVFDRDALQRSHVDEILSELYVKIITVEQNSLRGIEPEEGLANFTDRMSSFLGMIDVQYSRMNYASALNLALKASAHADQALSNTEGYPQSIEQLISELEKRMREIAYLGRNYSALKMEYQLLEERHRASEVQVNDLQERNSQQAEDLVQAQFKQQILLLVTGASLAISIFVTRKRWSSQGLGQGFSRGFSRCGGAESSVSLTSQQLRHLLRRYTGRYRSLASGP